MTDVSDLSCNFCTKAGDDVQKLIAGFGVFICNECIDLCHDILHDTPQRVEPEDLHATIVQTLTRHGHLPVYELADAIVDAVVEARS